MIRGGLFRPYRIFAAFWLQAWADAGAWLRNRRTEDGGNRLLESGAVRLLED